jgi:hypothetical protein
LLGLFFLFSTKERPLFWREALILEWSHRHFEMKRVASIYKGGDLWRTFPSFQPSPRATWLATARSTPPQGLVRLSSFGARPVLFPAQEQVDPAVSLVPAHQHSWSSVFQPVGITSMFVYTGIKSCHRITVTQHTC